MAQQLLKISNWVVPKLIEYEIEYNKLWADDTGSDMTGENKGTLLGVFPNLKVSVGEFNQNEMQQFLALVNKPKFNIDWYDEEKGDIATEVSYSIADYSISLKSSKHMVYNSFSFQLVPNQKR